jgi:hypothetical protein
MGWRIEYHGVPCPLSQACAQKLRGWQTDKRLIDAWSSGSCSCVAIFLCYTVGLTLTEAVWTYRSYLAHWYGPDPLPERTLF